MATENSRKDMSITSTSSDETSATLHPVLPQGPHYSPLSPMEATASPRSHGQKLGFLDLRAQIIANATILFPAVRLRSLGAGDLIEPHVIVAKTPRRQEQQQEHQTRHTDKQPDQTPTSKPPAKSLLPNAFKFGSREEKAKAEIAEKAEAEKAKIAQTVHAAAAALPPESHYALVVRLTTGVAYAKLTRIMLRGDPQDTAVEALEHLLELTETMLHETIVRYDINNESQLAV